MKSLRGVTIPLYYSIIINNSKIPGSPEDRGGTGHQRRNIGREGERGKSEWRQLVDGERGKNSLRNLFFNARSLFNKVDDLQIAVLLINPTLG